MNIPSTSLIYVPPLTEVPRTTNVSVWAPAGCPVKLVGFPDPAIRMLRLTNCEQKTNILIIMLIECGGENSAEPSTGNWLAVNLNDAGAQVRVGSQLRHVGSAVGYSSSCACTLHFGLGKQSYSLSYDTAFSVVRRTPANAAWRTLVGRRDF